MFARVAGFSRNLLEVPRTVFEAAALYSAQRRCCVKQEAPVFDNSGARHQLPQIITLCCANAPRERRLRSHPRLSPPPTYVKQWVGDS